MSAPPVDNLLEVLSNESKTTMKIIRYLSLIIIAFLLTGCFYPEVNAETSQSFDRQTSATSTLYENITIEEESPPISEAAPVPTKTLPTILPTSDLSPDLYGCKMRIEFASGPLEKQTSEFTVLDETYFQDKGDNFAVGKGTAIYYETQPYLILHSSYVNGNMLKPMEAEFIRKYLEHWGKNGNEFIQERIDALIGAQVNWYCNEDLILGTTINGITRLSHEASNRLWLQPNEIEDILEDKEGLTSEWIGEIAPTDDPSLYLGFCGWGPPSIENGRYTYYRYLLNFTIQNLN
ncbi:MAG TPA: hypothetical protein DCK95_06645 [Anaerolineaceae bacterium]|nr:hypothetical protein [Anaerolineaceae bacterium]